jgi:hypothetical protein
MLMASRRFGIEALLGDRSSQTLLVRKRHEMGVIWK